ncbi:hypothetical protein TWF694_001005 [Orbilia ellipsospora]|uniref:DUF427 domain-containing protein n=1 Tax=Orbilia ellipsospora TaxID=2528407 RepID=A0AAV9XR69_9PEZI
MDKQHPVNKSSSATKDNPQHPKNQKIGYGEIPEEQPKGKPDEDQGDNHDEKPYEELDGKQSERQEEESELQDRRKNPTPKPGWTILDPKKYLERKGTYKPVFPRPGHFERCKKRIRGSYKGILLFDTYHALYVWENAYFPTFYIPRRHFFEPFPLLRSRDKPRFDERLVPFLLGHNLATVVELDWELVLKNEVVTKVMCIVEGRLEGYVRVFFKHLEWKEEDDQIVSYPKDPYKRIDVHNSIRTIQIQIGYTTLQSDQVVVLLQNGYPPRFYFTMDIFKLKKGARKGPSLVTHKSGKKAVCPYKGEAEYFNLEIEGKVWVNIGWCYTNPNPEVFLIKDRYCFSNRQIISLKIEGALQVQEPIPVDYEMTPEELTLFTYEC